MAILFADLSGYTALTEVHGSIMAADLIDKYISLVKSSLVGKCKLQERVGDEIMIVSECADDLVRSTLNILSNTMKENNFLQIHGGLHYGKVLHRENSFYGSPINLTSRIAAKAQAGSILCSDDFVNALSNRSISNLISKGKCGFKNIVGEKEVYELNIEKKSYHIDPICHMVILDSTEMMVKKATGNLYFCSKACLEMYNEKNKLALN